MKKFLLEVLLFIGLTITVTPTAFSIITSNLQLQWHMDENVGVCSTDTVVGLGSKLLGGAAWSTPGVGGTGACVDFTGASGVCEMGCATGSLPAWFYTNKSSMTVEIWVYLNSKTGRQIINMGDKATQSWVLDLDRAGTGTGFMYFGVFGGGNGTDNTAVNTGAWHQIGFTYDTVNVRFFIDGNFTNTAACTGAVPTVSDGNPPLASMSYDNASVNLEGKADELRIYSMVLSTAQVQENYNDTLNPPSTAVVKKIRRSGFMGVIE